MRIMFIAPRYHTNQHYIIEALAENGYKIKFLVTHKGQNEYYTNINPTKLKQSALFTLLLLYYKIRYKYKFQDLIRIKGFPSPFRLLYEIMMFKPNLIIVRDKGNNFSKLAFLLCYLLRNKCILYNQHPYKKKMIIHVKPKINILNRIQRKINYIFDFTPAISFTPIMGDKEGQSSLHSYYIPLCINTNYKIENKVYFRENKINIIMIGKFQKRKNHILLLNTINNIKHLYPIKLTMICEKTDSEHEYYYNKTLEYINSNNLQDIVTIKLNLSYQDALKEYENNDLYVLPSSKEPAAFSILEAMSFGLPVICSDSCGTKCYINEEENGYIFESDNSHDLTLKIEEIIQNKNKLIKMGEFGYNKVLTEHNPKIFINTINTIYMDNFNEK